MSQRKTDAATADAPPLGPGNPAPGAGRGTNLRDWFGPGRFALVLGTLLAATFPSVVIGQRVFAYLDFGQFAFPVAYYHREAFWRGELPLWNPLSCCGIPFLAQWNTLTLYPLSLVYLLLPFPWSMGMFSLLHLFLGGLGMYFLAHRWTAHRLAAALGGLVFGFNGMTWYGLIWPHITAGMAWMPWVVLAVERAWRLGGPWLLGAVALADLQLLSGGAEVIVLTWLVLGVLWLREIWTGEIPRKRLVWRVLAIGCLAAGLAAVQLLPFIELLTHSQRTTGYGDSAMGVMPLVGWGNYLIPVFHCLRNPQGLYVPPNHWTGSYYLGVGIVPLAVWAVWRARTPRVWILFGLAGFGLLMALGGKGPLYDLVTRLLPFLGLLRFPVKYVILATFTVPLLAAIGLAGLLELPATRRGEEWRRARWVVLGLLGCMGLILLYAWNLPLAPGDLAASAKSAGLRLVFLVLVAGLIGQLCRGGWPRAVPWLQVALLVVAWSDIRTHNHLELSPTLPAGLFEPQAIRRVLGWGRELEAGERRVMQSPDAYWKLLAYAYANLELDTKSRRLSQFLDYNLLDGVPKVDGFYSLSLREFTRLNERLYGSTNAAAGLKDFLGVSFTSHPSNILDWVSRPSALPLVTAGQAPVFADDAAILDGLFSDRFDPLQSVYLSAALRNVAGSILTSKARVTPSFYSAREWSFDVEAQAPALVVIAQAHYPNWRATVDGHPVPLWRANYAFQALAVPSGQHRVTLRYADHGLRAGAMVSIIALLICVGLGFEYRRRAGRAEAAGPKPAGIPPGTHPAPPPNRDHGM